MAASSIRRVHEPYVFAALAFALTAGFGLAAILVGVLPFGIPLGAWWVASVQAHGHAQLFGWAGLFVLGVGLFFLPRLRGTVLARAELAPWALVCFAAGITLRALSQPLLGILAGNGSLGSSWGLVGRSGLVLSGILELAGALLVVVMLTTSFRRGRPLAPDAPILPVRPYLATAFISFGLGILLNVALATYTAFSGGFLYPSAWDNALTHLLISGFIVPIALSLSIRNLPLFMRLAFPPKRALSPILASYVIGIGLQTVGQVIEQTFLSSVTTAMGSILEGGALLVFIWQFDVLLRRKQPWITSRTPPPPGYIETRKPTRKHYPDYGEFGRFEVLIISAYAWLAFACIVSIINGVAILAVLPALSAGGTGSPRFNPDIERHAMTLGFITLLIFGMGVRMLPGFSGKSRVASTRLVMATFWLGNAAAFFRIAPLLAPDLMGANVALGMSGTIGWLAVACLAINLWRTFRSGTK
jgi:uncharacterized protein involved in response to NO